MATECPICGNQTMERRTGQFRFDPPENIPGGVIVMPGATWEECAECRQKLLPPELSDALEAERYKRLGLLRPEEIKQARERAGLTQTDMGRFVGVGEKTYTRWESGRSIQNKSSDNLIRLADRYPDLFVQLEAQREPDREKLIAEYLRGLQEYKGSNAYAMAAHGAELDPSLGEILRERLQKIAAARKKG